MREVMSDNLGRRKRLTLFWIVCLVVASFVAGIWAAFTPAITPFVKPSAAVVMIVAGLVFVSAFATSRPINELQRKARMRLSVMGAAFMLYGVAQVVPSVEVSLTLMGLNLLVMAAAATGRPKRFFARRS